MKPGLELADLDLSRIHLVGVGGAGMNALADVLRDLGYTVTGSDLRLSATTQALAERGVKIYEGHQAENISGATLLVKTAAAHRDNPELIAAAEQGVTVLTLAQMVGRLANARRCVAIAGTHGKTTTTALVSWLLAGAGLDPTFFIGGVSRDLGTAGRAGTGDIAVVEADEYARRFLEYQPEVAVITNLEVDHLDYYGSFEAIIAAFEQFAGQVQPGGTLLVKLPDEDEAGLIQLGQTLLEAGYLEERNYETFGLSDEPGGLATYEAVLLSMLNPQGGSDFMLYYNGELLAAVNLGLPGVHNVLNAAAALAVCHIVAPQIDMTVFAKLAAEFKGAARRFEIKGETGGVTIVDDYAHHPTEIKATLAAARSRFPNRRLIVLFQPHTYSRTKAHLDEFAASFSRANLVGIMEIFPARETDTLGVSSQALIDKITQPAKLTVPLTHQNALQAIVVQTLIKPGDVFLTLGAGDVWKVGEQLLSWLTLSQEKPE